MPSLAIMTSNDRGKGKKEQGYDHPDREWEVRDALHTIMRAHEHLQNKDLMKQVRKHAGKYASEKRDEAHRAQMLAKQGMISGKALEKMKAKA